MYIAIAAITYGPEYYRELLAESEDDILKPKRMLATQNCIAIARKHWRKSSVRPDAVVESGCYRGTNETLLYRDVVLRLI